MKRGLEIAFWRQKPPELSHADPIRTVQKWQVSLTENELFYFKTSNFHKNQESISKAKLESSKSSRVFRTPPWSKLM